MLLAKSRPIVVISMTGGSHFARECLMAFTPWHLDAVSGSHPPHLLWVDSVEKVFFRRREKFFRAADAFRARRREGPHRFTQKRRGTFTLELWTLAATERYENRLSLDFWRRSIFDFCNT